MAKHPPTITSSHVWIFYGLLVLYSCITFHSNMTIALGELAIVFLVWLYFRKENRRRKKELLQYLDQVTSNLEAPVNDNLEQTPLPMLVHRMETGMIVWANEHFSQLVDEDLLTATISKVLPNFEGRWLLEGKTQSPTEQMIGEKRFIVFGSMVRNKGKGKEGYLATTYWIDVTEYSAQREQLVSTRPVVGVILLDNYDDLMRNQTETQSATMSSSINQKLGKWVEECHGLLKRFDRESYLLILEKQYLDQLIEKKFDVLDSIHEVVNPVGITASVSIGIGTDGEHMEELLNFANLSIEMALSRGGDQVVIRNKHTFEFYGGRAAETEKRTKVKSRVMANALAALIADSSRVFIMGHKYPDMDALGAAAGVFSLARKKNTPSYIIRQGKDSAAEELYEKLGALGEYHEKFITAQEALVLADSRSLLVVVDTNRPDQVQAIELLQSCNRVAVIDHHRRASEYIEGAVLNYHELYASSACELVAELLQYTIEPTDLRREEAEALLAGIVLDTKNFTLRTGARTFEAASFLRRCGADTNEVRKLFQNDLEGAILRYKIVQSAQVFSGRDDIAFARSETEVPRVTAAQAADELLNIRGISTSFVLFQKEEEVIISARSMGEINVQLVLEPLGGGGNAAAAGVQMPNTALSGAFILLQEALEKYLKSD